MRYLPALLLLCLAGCAGLPPVSRIPPLNCGDAHAVHMLAKARGVTTPA